VHQKRARSILFRWLLGISSGVAATCPSAHQDKTIRLKRLNKGVYFENSIFWFFQLLPFGLSRIEISHSSVFAGRGREGGRKEGFLGGVVVGGGGGNGGGCVIAGGGGCGIGSCRSSRRRGREGTERWWTEVSGLVEVVYKLGREK